MDFPKLERTPLIPSTYLSALYIEGDPSESLSLRLPHNDENRYSPRLIRIKRENVCEGAEQTAFPLAPQSGCVCDVDSTCEIQHDIPKTEKHTWMRVAYRKVRPYEATLTVGFVPELGALTDSTHAPHRTTLPPLATRELLEFCWLFLQSQFQNI